MIRKYLPLTVMAVFVLLRITSLNDTSAHINILPLYVDNARNRLIQMFVNSCQKSLPSPHSDLVLGMTIGYDSIDKNRIYNDNLIKSGLIHVVVVSGYNISLVLSFMARIIIPTPYSSRKYMIPILLLFYVILCGFQAPIIRASLMGYLLYMSKNAGRALPILQLLIFTAFLMMLISPDNVRSVSFWLSFSATFSLLLFSETVVCMASKIRFPAGIKHVFAKSPFLVGLAADFCTSISAQVLVWPIISYVFGRISLISPLSNMFVLWLVPLSTILGFLLLSAAFFGPLLAHLVGLAIFPLLDLFVRISSFFAGFPLSSVNLKVPLVFLVCYYSLTLGFALVYSRKNKHAYKSSD
jgi:competence protein ComEC